MTVKPWQEADDLPTYLTQLDGAARKQIAARLADDARDSAWQRRDA
ncbi:hypothetical protein [Nonomuraea soli]|uniref:Uncharacterized protein n=1 Tax=Nonomuraea soli TaxID=1032476 RepID=A0A7W0HPY2_9ACTN|nr:hypothetical protein [Nonomuraea soli]MBA2891338.1 hypothetical protein [Nonomuraea soli]